MPGFHAFEERVAIPGGFVLPSGPRDSRTFPTSTGKANFTVNPPDTVDVPPGHLLLQTVRSHDQFNTTVYGLDDRYRGIKGGRRVVFVNADDLASFGLADGDLVDLVSVWTDGERRAKAFRAVAYPTPPGLRRRVLPRGQRARAARLGGRDEQHPDVEVDRDPARARAARRRDRGRECGAHGLDRRGPAGHQLDLSRSLVQQHQRTAEHAWRRPPPAAAASRVGHGE